MSAFRDDWERWLMGEKDEHVPTWRARVDDRYERAWRTLLGTDFDPDSFSPFHVPIGPFKGYCLLTLQIALWATQWSMRDAALPAPDGFPGEVFERTGPHVLGWVVMIGEDADTYGAAAGPLVAALHGGLPEAMTDGMWILKDPLMQVEAHS